MSLGLLLLRLFLAALLCGHATQKLFGWFRGAGPQGTGVMFEAWGFRPGTAMVLVAGASELLGAASIATGLLTPAGCAVIAGTMIVAAAPNAPNGLWAHLGGCEVPVVYAGLAVVLACTGPGRYSLDRLLGVDTWHGAAWGAGVLVLAALAATPVLLRRRAALRADATNAVTTP